MHWTNLYFSLRSDTIMATIKIYRPNAFYGKLISWNIKINDKKVDKISRDEQKSVQVPAGTHIVQINSGGKGGSNSNKLKITLDEDQAVYLKIEVHYSFWKAAIPLYSILNRNNIIKLVPE